MTRIIRHEMPDPPPEHPRKTFTLNHLRLPAWLCPHLLESPEGGRVVELAGIRAPIFDPGDSVTRYGLESIRAEQRALRRDD